MKTVNSILFIAIAILLMVNSGCTPEPPVRPVQPPPLPPPPVYHTIWADANADIIIETPANSIMLNGRANSSTQITTVTWKKISGPATCVIENPQTLQTKVSNIERGTYEFELYVKDNAGYFYVDTMTLKVEDPIGTSRQILFLNMKVLVWSGPFDGHLFLEIENFDEFVPSINPFTVYIKMDSSLNWEPVVLYPPNNPSFTGYVYGIANTNNKPSLFINKLSDDLNTTDILDIKIVY